MSEDYEDAAKRHWQDAQLLFGQTPPRLANASHLYGMSAECSLKAIARHHSSSVMFYGRNGHMPALFVELTNISAIGTNPSLVAAIDQVQADFTTWSVDQRYENEAHFNALTTGKQQSGAQKANQLLNEVLGGRI